MRRCVLCKKKQDGSGSFFSVPKDERRRQLWINVCQVHLKASSYVCEDHFAPADIIKGGRIFLMPNAVPSIGIAKNQMENNSISLVTPLVESNENASPPPEIVFTNEQSVDSHMQLLNTLPLPTQLVEQTVWNGLPGLPNCNDYCGESSNAYQQFLNIERDNIKTDCNSASLLLPFDEHTSNENSGPPPQIVFTNEQSVDSRMQLLYTLPLPTQFVQQKVWNDLPSLPTIEKSFIKTACFPEQPIKKFQEQATQTDPVIVIDDKKSQYEKMRDLKTKIKDLELKLMQTTAAVDSMSSIFTKGQIRKLMVPGEIKWKWEDISKAICLHASGPRAYNHLYVKGFPLPHVTTLRRWCRKINISEGIITTSIDFMRHVTDLTSDDKVCVLAFDEMKVMETFDYDSVRDIVQKPANYVQVVMARGLRKSWKQPIFFNYDCQMTAEILYEIISALHYIDFPVVAIVCDNGPSNRKLWRNLGVTSGKFLSINL